MVPLLVPPSREPSGLVPPAAIRAGAPVSVMTRLALGPSQTTASEALVVGDCTAGSVDIVLFAFESLTSIQIDVEMGNDSDNWSPVCTTILRRAGSVRFRYRGVGGRYIRLYYRASGSPGGIGLLTTTVCGSGPRPAITV